MRGPSAIPSFDKQTVAFVLHSASTRTAYGTDNDVRANVFPLTQESDEAALCLVESVTTLDQTPHDMGTVTRGTPIYTDNFHDLYGRFNAAVFADIDGNEPLTMSHTWGGTGKHTFTAVSGHDSYYAHRYADGLRWPEADGALLFFMEAPIEATEELLTTYYADGHLEFDYEDPTPSTDVADRPTLVDATNAQRDLLFTSKRLTEKTKDTDNALLFYHVLTGVRFIVGTMEEGTSAVITRVTLKDVKANGHCVVTPDYTSLDNTSLGGHPSNADGDAPSRSAACALWTAPSLTDERIVDYTQKPSDDYLLLVPQTLTDTEVIIDFTLNGRPYRRTAKLSTVWKAGELHTYTLTVNKVDVSISDVMDDALMVKTDVTTANTGNVTAYLRATITGAWYYGYGDESVAVAVWQGGGHFDGLPGTDWLEGKDGCYYYRHPVRPGSATANALFSRFTAPTPTEEAPFPGAHLELTILLQGVQYDTDANHYKERVTTAWGNAIHVSGQPIVALLNNTPEPAATH